MNNKLLLHEEIVLLALSDEKGTFSGGMFVYALAGAMVSELLLQEKITASQDKKQIVKVRDRSPTGDPFLDELHKQIIESRKPRSLKDWVFKASSFKKLPHRVAEQLCQKGALKQDKKKVLWLFTRHIYPELDGSWEDAVCNRMAAVMFDKNVLPDERTAVLIALANHSELLKPNFPKDKLRQHKARIKELAAGKLLAAGATQSAIEAVQIAVLVATTIPIVVTTTSTAST